MTLIDKLVPIKLYSISDPIEDTFTWHSIYFTGELEGRIEETIKKYDWYWQPPDLLKGNIPDWHIADGEYAHLYVYGYKVNLYLWTIGYREYNIGWFDPKHHEIMLKMFPVVYRRSQDEYIAVMPRRKGLVALVDDDEANEVAKSKMRKKAEVV